MSKLYLFASLSMVFAVTVMMAGCSNPPPAAHDDAAMTEEHQGHMDHGDDHTGDGASTHAGHGPHAEALADLSPADRELAEKQKTCPVSGEPLGAMGTPYKVTVQGQAILLCCPGCEEKIKANPEEYLAKLPK